jgi:aminoglycoside phosphotransferase (APT) family kinase protein
MPLTAETRWLWDGAPATIGQVSALHEDELPVDAGLVRRLVDRSLPQYSGLSIEPLSRSGSSNSLFRLGDELLVRLPRQPGGSTTIEKEARWLPVVAAGLTTAVPEVVGLGEPGFGYPEKWAVTTRLEGQVPAVPWDVRTGSSERLALGLAQVVTELRQLGVPPEADEDPALSWYRGGRLADLDRDFRRSLDECRRIADLSLDLDRVLSLWGDALAAESAVARLRSWYHGDLLAENLLARADELVAVLDFGGLAVGDPTVDLMVAWEVLDQEGRETFRRALGVDDAEWAKGMGWAAFVAMVTFPYYWDTMPARCETRRTMVAAVLDEL